MSSRCKSDGFTLIEILVAFMVLAIAIAATIRMSSGSIELTQHLRARLLADWVAQDRLEEYRALGTWPAIGVREGAVEQGGYSFYWREVVAPTQFARFRRVEVIVFPKSDPDTVLSRMVAAMAAPAN